MTSPELEDGERTVAVPSPDGQGDHWHAAGAPCGSHLTVTVEATAAELVFDRGLSPCTTCREHHGLETPYACDGCGQPVFDPEPHDVGGRYCAECWAYLTDGPGDPRHEQYMLRETTIDGGTATGVRRADSLTTDDLLARVVVPLADGDQYEGRVQRGSRDRKDRRYVSVVRDSGEGAGSVKLRVRPDRLDALIQTLVEVRTALLTENLRTPGCIYCGEAVADAVDARDHHRDAHADRAYGNDYDPAYYESDPNGTIAQLRAAHAAGDETGGADDE